MKIFHLHSVDLFKKKGTGFIALLFFIAIFSCKGKDVKEGETEMELAPVSDSLQTVRSILFEDSIMIFANKANDWLSQSFKKPTLNWRRFHLQEFWYEDSLNQTPVANGPAFYKKFAPVLRWSPDSNYVLDMGSLNKTILKDSAGNSTVTDGDIDTQVSLLYPKAGTKSQLLFFGAGTSLVDARWVDSAQVAIFGIRNKMAGQRADTLLWIINARDNYFRRYKWE